MYVYGIHPGEEILRSAPDRVVCIYAARPDAANLAELRKLAAAYDVRIERAEAAALDTMAQGGNHQGLVLETTPFRYAELDDVLADIGDRPHACVLVLEQVQDPGNLGAILRSAAGMGVDAVLVPKDRATGVTATVVRASAGMAFRVPVVRVVNVARTLRELREHGFWSVGTTAGERARDLWDIDFAMRTALVLGGEHQGIRRLVEETCDLHARIPMATGVESLNVASAASIFLYEIRRQITRAQLAGG